MQTTAARRERRSWAAIRDAAYTVVELTRTPSGLWQMPAGPGDWTVRGSEPNTALDSIRDDELQEHFEMHSISVTWKALHALAAAHGRRPAAATEAIRAISQRCRAPSGGYGIPNTRRSRFSGVPKVIDSPRHTAMALLTVAEFAEGGLLSMPPDQLQQTVRWLLNERIEGAGWTHVSRGGGGRREVSFGMSTAACLAALCVAKPVTEAAQLSAVSRDELSLAIQEGWASLLASRRGPLWSADDDGSSAVSQIGDAAFIVCLVRSAMDAGLGTLVPQANEDIDGLLEGLVAIGDHRGWPHGVVPECSALLPTICMSQALRLFPQARAVQGARDKIEAASDWIRTADEAGHLEGEDARCWDWICLLQLASSRGDALNESTARRLRRFVEPVRIAWSRKRLGAAHINRLPQLAREPVVFALTRGTAKLSGRPDWAPSSSDVMRGLIVTVIVATAGALWKWGAELVALLDGFGPHGGGP